jgi:hypothetical protein
MVHTTIYSTISLGGAFGLSSVRSAPTVMIVLAFVTSTGIRVSCALITSEAHLEHVAVVVVVFDV